MGKKLTAHCTQCTYSKDFAIGAGMFFNRIDAVKPLFTESAAREIDSLMSQNPPPMFTADKLLAVCAECDSLEELPTIIFHPKDHPPVEIRNICSCTGRLSPVDYLTTEISCPNCKAILEIQESGHWD